MLHVRGVMFADEWKVFVSGDLHTSRKCAKQTYFRELRKQLIFDANTVKDGRYC